MPQADSRPVLDKGFVRLVDFMGGDAGVVDAARVSYGGKSKGEEADRKLIAYLVKHSHMTPFEHAVFKFHVKTPIFVMRQWIRHRMACVTGDTELYFDLPSGPRNGERKSYRMTVEEFHRKWHEGAKPIPHAKRPSKLIKMPQRERLRRMLLRNLDESNWTIRTTRVMDVFKTGEKPVFDVVLEDGKTVRCTKDHRFLFENGGWMTLEAAVGLKLSGDLAAFNTQLPRLAVNGRAVANPLYRDREWLEAQYRRPKETDASIAQRLGVSAMVIRKWWRIHGLVGIKPAGFVKGERPWNKGRSYQLWNGSRVLSREHREAIRSARSGARSNFWKGGVASERASVARWTTEVSPKVFARDAYRCRDCGTIGGKLHAHHVIPVWADPTRALDLKNLVAVCAACHRRIHASNSELSFAAELLGRSAVEPYRKVEKRRPVARHLVPDWVRIASIRYAGIHATYDLTVDGPDHNYVANGIVTHNSYNEISARYTEVKDEFYIPTKWRGQDVKNKQGSVAAPALDHAALTAKFETQVKSAQDCYKGLLAAGVARELARMVLPVNAYTEFYWTVNARSFMNFLVLRAEGHAQWEIQQYAEALAADFRDKMPWTYDAFLAHVWKGGNPTLDAEAHAAAARQPVAQPR